MIHKNPPSAGVSRGLLEERVQESRCCDRYKKGWGFDFFDHSLLVSATYMLIIAHMHEKVAGFSGTASSRYP